MCSWTVFSRTTAFLGLTVLVLLAGCDQHSLTGDMEPEDQAPFHGTTTPKDDVIPGQYIVVFNERVRNVPEHALQAVGRHDGSLLSTYEHSVRGFSARLPEQAVAALERNPNIAYIVPDGVVQSMGGVQQDATWGLDRIDQRDEELDGAYHYTATGKGVNIYIVDSGIRSSHADFGGRVRFGRDVLERGRANKDCNGHGTHVAGTVGGATWGVAKDATLWNVRVLDCEGFGTWGDVIEAVDWITDHHQREGGPSVVNMSLGGAGNAALDDAVRASIEAGVSYVVAAGNSFADACLFSPARISEAMTISATDETDSRPFWANHGPCVDWFAPGLNITSAWHTGRSATYTMNGTSMAAPHVAGAAALFLETNPSASPSEVYQHLYEWTTKDIVGNAANSNNHLLYTGWDRVGEPDDPEPVTAGFEFECENLTCSFSETSTGPVHATRWEFGDGGASTEQHPTHTYHAEGTYAVTLAVTGEGGDLDVVSKELRVREAGEDDDPDLVEPVIDAFEVTTRTTGPWYRARVTWSVSHEAGALTSVTSELLDGESVVDTESTTVNGSSASHHHNLRTRDAATAIRLTVMDAEGNTVTETKEL